MSVQEPTTAAPLNGLLKLQSAVPASEDSSNTLIVEDEEALARSMQRILKSRGIAVDTAFSGAEARERLAAGSYAVVLLDVRLPDESGYGLLGELRALRPDIAVRAIERNVVLSSRFTANASWLSRRTASAAAIR